MELPLTPLEFARRARRLYADREAVVDGDLRLTYAQFFDRCDRWSHVLQTQLGVGHGDRVAYIAPNTHAQLESFYAVPQLGAVLVPINYRLTADDFAYIIGHSGARSRLRPRRLPRRGRQHPRPDPGRRALRRARRRARRLARLRSSCSAAAPPEFFKPDDRRERPAHHQLHQRHDLAPQGRDDHPPQRVHERRRHAGPRPHDARRTRTCGRCRCSTPTAGRSSGSSRRSAPGTSACGASSRRASSSWSTPSRSRCCAPRRRC